MSKLPVISGRRLIALQTTDGEILKIPYETMKCSMKIRSIMEKKNTRKAIRLETVSSRDLQHVVALLNTRKRTVFDITADDFTYDPSLFKGMTYDDRLSLICAVHELDIEPMVDLVYRGLIEKLTLESVEDCRIRMGIDFSSDDDCQMCSYANTTNMGCLMDQPFPWHVVQHQSSSQFYGNTF